MENKVYLIPQCFREEVRSTTRMAIDSVTVTEQIHRSFIISNTLQYGICLRIARFDQVRD
jgi:hypothetical protein